MSTGKDISAISQLSELAGFGFAGHSDIGVTRIAAPDRWQAVNVRELWRFRELLCFLVWRDVKVRYKQTVLGACWAVLQPAAMMAVFTICFSRLGKPSTDTLPYPLFAYVGLVAWTFFATAVANAGNSVVGSERLISKVYFPRLVIPFAAIGAAFVDFVVAFAMLVVLLAYYRIPPTSDLIFLPLIFALIALTATGVGTLLAALNVAYRDVRHVIPFLMQLWMFATPTIYMRSVEGGNAGRLTLAMNPMSGLIAAFRASCTGAPIDWAQAWPGMALAPVLLVTGCVVFRRIEKNFADLV